MSTSPEENQAVQEIIDIQAHLKALKRDRSKFIQSDEVLKIYDTLADKLKVLVNIHKPEPLPKQQEELVEDVFQLMSLALLTIGHNRRASASFASLCTVQQLLEHLNESSTYTEQDVEPIKERLTEIERVVNQEIEQEAPEVIDVVRRKVDQCKQELADVEKPFENLAPELVPTMEKLVKIRREIMAVCSKPNFSASHLKPMKEELKKIDGKRVEGKFVNDDGSVPKGQATVNGLLEKCSTLISDFSAKSSEEYIDPGLKSIYTQLCELKNALENLLVTHRWTLRETDLYFYQSKLSEIDAMRVNGVFKVKSAADKPHTSTSSGTGTPPTNPDLLRVDETNKTSGSSTPLGAPKGQSILLYLLRRCYAIIYKLLESSEPVSEALTPIHNQLTTVRRCLLEVKRMGGLSSVRELYPYQMKLASVDQLRVDGKFMVGETVPEGQGMLNALLAECFDICHELKVEMEEERD